MKAMGGNPSAPASPSPRPGLKATGRAGYCRSWLRRGRSSFRAVRCNHLSRVTPSGTPVVRLIAVRAAAGRRSSLSAQGQRPVGPADLEDEAVAADVVERDLEPGLAQGAGKDRRHPADMALVEPDLLAHADRRLERCGRGAADPHLRDDETGHV